MSVTPKRQRLLLELLSAHFGREILRGNPKILRHTKRADRLVVTLDVNGHETTYEMTFQRTKR